MGNNLPVTSNWLRFLSYDAGKCGTSCSEQTTKHIPSEGPYKFCFKRSKYRIGRPRLLASKSTGFHNRFVRLFPLQILALLFVGICEPDVKITMPVLDNAEIPKRPLRLQMSLNKRKF
jgi:hypothetical protein